MKRISAWRGQQTAIECEGDGYYILRTPDRLQPYTVFRWPGREGIKTLYFTETEAQAHGKVAYEVERRRVTAQIRRRR